MKGNMKCLILFMALGLIVFISIGALYIGRPKKEYKDIIDKEYSGIIVEKIRQPVIVGNVIADTFRFRLDDGTIINVDLATFEKYDVGDIYVWKE